ncbi:MAG: hypothetical protein HYY13_03705 [Nitrospirae bacterium]|nr:hypothetical protein [Nitrospirota bacterium]
MAEDIDLGTVAKIARRARLLDIQLALLQATTQSRPGGELVPAHKVSSVLLGRKDSGAVIASSFAFTVTVGQAQVAEVSMTFHLVYEFEGQDPLSDDDIGHFARGNGTYHAWPYMREMLSNLLPRMGFPPFTLPVLVFGQPQRQAPQSETKQDGPRDDQTEVKEPTV